MLIAKVQNEQVIEVADYRDLFPNTSFAVTGPDAAFLAENSCMTVTVFKAYDADTEKLVNVSPYVEGNTVYTVAVEPLTEEEITARNESKKAKVKAKAEALLKESDWSQYPDVSNPANTPHLSNYDAWMFYRLELRSIAITPPIEVAVWPVKPEEQWSV